ncbi:MAG: hypothetical protein H0V00_15505, partial [Chloroflexia bacterium]|nr:hypothetical protein [Chloroflexia bacterium]
TATRAVIAEAIATRAFALGAGAETRARGIAIGATLFTSISWFVIVHVVLS